MIRIGITELTVSRTSTASTLFIYYDIGLMLPLWKLREVLKVKKFIILQVLYLLSATSTFLIKNSEMEVLWLKFGITGG